jgi:hypothetical protein
MFYTNTTFLGIDPTAGQKPFSYAAVDHDLRMLALGQGTFDEVMAFMAGQRQAFVAVCAPRRPNRGLLAQPEVRQNLSPLPRPGRWLDFRLAEYLLRQHNITVPQTPCVEQDCPNWMQMGFNLFRRLEELGYQYYPEGDAKRQCLEVYPHASFSVLLGQAPFPKNTLEGRLQRQLVLHEQKLNVPDPMRVFEEITRHRLLKGILLTDDLFTPGELDALVGAYTAWVAATHPEKITLLGDHEEGQIVLPIPQLKERY